MTLRLPGRRSLNRVIKRVDRKVALQACLHHDPRRIYCGLLHIARERGWKDGTAYHAFVEIYGVEPQRLDRGPPMPPPIELKEWISLRPKWKRPTKQKKPRAERVTARGLL